MLKYITQILGQNIGKLFSAQVLGFFLYSAPPPPFFSLLPFFCGWTGVDAIPEDSSRSLFSLFAALNVLPLLWRVSYSVYLFSCLEFHGHANFLQEVIFLFLFDLVVEGAW